MRKTKAEARQTREALLAAALDVFYRRGVSHASLQEISAAAGLTRGALYWHFKNKEDLFDALFQQWSAEISTQLDSDIATASPDIWRNLLATSEQFLHRLADDADFRKFCHILHLNCEFTEDNHTIVALVQQYQAQWQQQLRQAFRICVQHGALHPDTDIEQAAFYCHATLKGILDIWLSTAAFDLKTTGLRLMTACRTTPICATTRSWRIARRLREFCIRIKGCLKLFRQPFVTAGPNQSIPYSMVTTKRTCLSTVRLS
ncbi:TetR/AcrR family acrAB operon transcriptional repressor [Neisseria sp. HSC-16F19]|nr:TetR family transcriptional regulator [Neisseria sp. HSC-16F19]MCP2040957.1 TetR/AcrR family acrAB operon transcriptional repressor [Neisseria sp. HSC-16F19]